MQKSEESPLDLIQKLSDERQHLWRLAGRQRLTGIQCDRIEELNRAISGLWHSRRCEIAYINRDALLDAPPETRYNSPEFVDYVKRMNDAVEAQSIDVDDLPYIYHQSKQLDIIDMVQEAMALAREDAVKKKLEKQRKEQHKMALRELMAQRKETLRWKAGRASVVKL